LAESLEKVQIYTSLLLSGVGAAVEMPSVEGSGVKTSPVVGSTVKDEESLVMGATLVGSIVDPLTIVNTPGALALW
jgi:hypothetical protein